MQLVTQFLTAFLSGILDATKKAKAFSQGISAQASDIQNLMNGQQAAQQQAQGEVLSQYEAGLIRQKLIYEIEAIAFVVVLIILAFVVSSIINKK